MEMILTPEQLALITGKSERAQKRYGSQEAELDHLGIPYTKRIKNQRGKAAARALGDHATEANTERYLRDREIPIVDGPSMAQIA
jgi:hypothetical protein